MTLNMSMLLQKVPEDDAVYRMKLTNLEVKRCFRK